MKTKQNNKILDLGKIEITKLNNLQTIRGGQELPTINKDVSCFPNICNSTVTEPVQDDDYI